MNNLCHATAEEKLRTRAFASARPDLSRQCQVCSERHLAGLEKAFKAKQTFRDIISSDNTQVYF